MRAVPEELTRGPFTRQRALELGVTSRMLEGRRFVRVHPRVFKLGDRVLDQDGLVRAAQLALPQRVHLTGISRLQHLGLDYGPRTPVRLVIEGDHHLAIEGIFLHRTRKLPPLDDVGVTVEAAFVAYCRQARVIDAIKAGDWLLEHGELDAGALEALAVAELWRPGSNEALWVMPHLVPDSWSLKESEVRALLCFAGLPAPECNKPLDPGAPHSPIADLLYRQWRTAVEYEGLQHQQDRRQYHRDLDRYADYRDGHMAYVQVTDEHLRSPQELVRRVHRALVRNGYDGPVPRFGEWWRTLFAPLTAILASTGGPARRR